MRAFLGPLVLFAGTFLAFTIPVFFASFTGLINKFKRPRIGQLEIFILRLRAFGLWISYWESLEKELRILSRSFTASDLLVYLLEY